MRKIQDFCQGEVEKRALSQYTMHTIWEYGEVGITGVSKTPILGSSPSTPALNHVGFRAAMYPTWYMAPPNPTMYYTYVLKSLKDDRFYIGYTNNLRNRLQAHRGGKVVSTRDRRPLVLIYYEAHLHRFDAKRRERYYKTSKGKASLKQITRNAY